MKSALVILGVLQILFSYQYVLNLLAGLFHFEDGVSTVVIITAIAQFPRFIGAILYVLWFMYDNKQTKKCLVNVF